MKIAIVCDDLIQHGGAERVFLKVVKIFPQADVFTSVASAEWKHKCEELGINLHTSFLQKFPFAVKLNRYYSPFLFHVFAFESFDLTNFDLVLSLSARYAHFVITKPGTRHVCYMHSPPRMFWEPFDYFEFENYGALKFLRPLAKLFLSLPLLILRIMDFVAIRSVDLLLANSKTPQKRINKYYRKECSVLYPCIDDRLLEQLGNSSPTISAPPYYLMVGRLVPWKRFDIAIRACNTLGKNLKIIGEGPDLARLKSIAGDSKFIEFLGPANDQAKVAYLKGCSALIHTQKEDFGLVPVEAMYFGKPVIAYGAGGALETVEQGVTGEFFYEQTPEALILLLSNFDRPRYDSAVCKKSATRFGEAEFERNLLAYISQSL